ncbi:hypothetical protein G6L08_34430 [Agrobacterium rhizogenes]|nr:hypothetical protein [Rhizobium rhizogenes]NTG32241.1 hypothetical protein [Rhizobium rhizogenes]
MTEETTRKTLLPNASAMNSVNHVCRELWLHGNDLHCRHAELRNRHELDRPCDNAAFDNLFIAHAMLRDCRIGIERIGEDYPSAAFRIFRQGSSALDQDYSLAATNKKAPT